MAKKNKKQTRKVSGVSSLAEANLGGLKNGAAQSSAAAGITSRLSGADFNPDYSQTIKDLKRIGTLAGTFFVVLVIISLFLR